MKQRTPLTKREAAMAVVTGICLVLLSISGLYIAHLRQAQTNTNNLVNGKDTLLRQDSAESNKTANYIDTICAEYRKLYGAYTDLQAQHATTNTVGYSKPGAAKGEVDQCYQD